MKIRCQEHYDKVVEYAKSIGDTTFQNCIERLKQWENNSNGRYEIELYRDIHSVLRKWPLTEAAVLSEDCFTMENRTSLMRLH